MFKVGTVRAKENASTLLRVSLCVYNDNNNDNNNKNNNNDNNNNSNNNNGNNNKCYSKFKNVIT